MCEVNSTLELLEDLYSKYLQVSDEMKVKLLKTLLSNCTLKAGKVSYTYKKPFCYIAETDCFEKNTRDAIRTHDLPLRRRLLYPAELLGLGSRGFKQAFGFLGYLYNPSYLYTNIKIFLCKVFCLIFVYKVL